MLLRNTALALALSAGLATAANAVITVSIYTDQPAAAGNATIAQASTLVANATTTVNAIDFTDAPGNDSTTFTVGAFLKNPVGLAAATANHTLNNTYFLFTGQTYLNAGANSFVVPHDDGLQLSIQGIGIVLDQPGPTAPVDSPFTVNAPTAGMYNFTLAYGEVAGGPAVLKFTVNGAPVGGVPEPATWALLLTGFGMVGYAMRKRQSAVVTA